MAGAAGADRIPPFNLDAERSVLGACLLDREALMSVVEGLNSDDFYDPRHRLAFDTIHNMVKNDLAVDSITFREEAANAGIEERLGGLPFIAALVDAVTTTANVEYHIGIVRDKAVHRGLIRVGGEITMLGYSEDVGVDAALETAEQKVFEIARTGKNTTIKDAQRSVSLAVQDIERRLSSGVDLTGVPTGFTDLDKITGGLQSGGLYILAARPSMGKTAFAMNIAQHAAAEENMPVLIFSLEMSAEQLIQRMLSSESEVNIREMFESQQMVDDKWRRLMSAADKISRSPIYIDDSSSLNTMDLRGRCRRFFAKHKQEKGLVVVDYLQLMDVASSRNAESRQQQVSEISRALKGVAREFNVPVLALSQLSRAVETRGGSKRPQLSDLRDSGAIEQDADMVVFLYREAYYAMEAEHADPTSEVIIAKHRNGATGKVELIFLKEYSKFANRMGGGFIG